MNTPACPPCPSSTSILHDLIAKLFLLRHCTTVAPLPPPLCPASCQPSSSSASAATHILHLCCRTFVDYCFLLLSSASLLPLCHQLQLLVRCSISRVSSAAIILHLIRPSLLVCRCACCTLVDCCLPLVAAPLLLLRHHSCCLSVVICHVVCRGATVCTKMNIQVG